MEWIEGEPLSAYRSAPVHEVIRLAYGIASALDALHVQGILHRDIAFDNVLVETRRFGRNPRLIDLGVAKDISSNEDLTMAGAFSGRVPFASPELLTGEGAAGARRSAERRLLVRRPPVRVALRKAAVSRARRRTAS